MTTLVGPVLELERKLALMDVGDINTCDFLARHATRARTLCGLFQVKYF
jgi:hypothetical protein